jgi:DNA-binding protein Fis
MTNEQVGLAQQMSASGITQTIIAAYFGVSASTINRKLKNYGTTTRKTREASAE